MKVSYEWLKEFVDINEDPKKVADTITMAGLEVEKIINTGIGKANVVAVEIIDIQKHSQADKLFVTRVDAGKFGKKQIVTNVTGLQKGQKIIAALEGAKLASGIEIKNTKLKGIESQGMFVGWEELGVPQKSEDLFYLDNSISNGTNYNEILAFNDSVIDIELTANRGDCLGMIGIAREVKTIFDKKVKELDLNYNTISKKVCDIFSVEIQSKNCLRYCGGVIFDVTIKPSPYWMQLKLIKAGIRPINNVVDITNYILLECNQPLHAFDMDKIGDKKIIVRDAHDNEKLTTLDNIERKLEAADIVIADPFKGHCIGGIMGGQISEVTESTKNIFLEAAFFTPEIIRKTSKRTGLRSESSYRFERAIDKEKVDWALKRALYMFDKLGVGKVCNGIIDVYTGKTDKSIISGSAKWINNKLGTDISQKMIVDILEKLGFVVKIDSNNLNITVPGWRNDVTIKEDIAEEIARIYGYNNIKHTHFPSFQSAARTQRQNNEKMLRELLYKIGCDETVNYSFVGKSLFDKMLLPADHDFRNIIALDVPLTDDWAGMRNSLIPGMIKTAAFNISRQNKSLSLFEIGNTNIDNKKEFSDEQKNVSIILGGYKKYKDYTSGEEKYDFYDIKGIVNCIFDYFRVEAIFKPSNEVYLHPFQQANIFINDKKAGIIGKLHPLICDSFDMDIDVFIAEISTKILFDNYTVKIVYEEVPKYPSSVRDLAIVVDNSVTADAVLSSVKNSNIDILRHINIFDIYSGKNIEAGKYSIAITLTFNKISSTLTDSEVDMAVNKILNNLKEKCGARIRG